VTPAGMLAGLNAAGYNRACASTSHGLPACKNDLETTVAAL